MIVTVVRTQSGFVATLSKYVDLWSPPTYGPPADSPDASVRALFDTVTVNEFFTEAAS
jgi:hypothetical protein